MVKGRLYSFKVQAINNVGVSALSQPISILAAQMPAQPIAPVTSINELNVVVRWTAPDNGGSAITDYDIRIKTNSGSYEQQLTDCDGRVYATVMSRTCSIPISSLIVAPFSLPWGVSVFATVTAINKYDRSQTSLEGNGAIILRAPDPPVNLENNGDITSGSQIGLTWA